MDWEGSESTLTVDGRSITVAAAPYSLGCSVRGRLVRVNSRELLRNTPIAGRIVILEGELTAEPLMPKSLVFRNPDEHKEIISILEKQRPLAVLTVSTAPNGPVPVIEDGDFELPCGILLPDSLELLPDGAAACLTIGAVRKPSSGANVIASYGSGSRKLCFSAHFDTKPGTPGALDNASGTAVLLALASELAGRSFPYRIEFVLFNGEDYYSNPGEMAYLASHLSTPSDYLLAFNIDGVGVKGHDTSYSFYECPEDQAGRIREAAAAAGGFMEIEPWPQGDHTLFSFSGVPAVAITSESIFELVDQVIHTENDKPEQIDVEKLVSLVHFLLSVI